MDKKGLNPLSVVVATTSTSLIGPNPHRTALIISSGLTNRFSVAFGVAAILDSGLTIRPGVNPIILSRDVLGDAITQAVTAIFAAVGEVVAVLEVLTAP